MVLAVLGCLSTSAFSATSSAIVGFYEVAVPTGNSAWVCGLVTADSYQGAAVTVTADTDGKALIAFTSPGWTASAFSLHYAEPQSGTCQGLAIDILSNTTDMLKLDTTPAAAGLTTGMVFIVRKHNTLAGMMPTGGGFSPFDDSLSLFSSTGQQTSYFWNSSNSTWINALGTNSNNTIVRPGQGFVILASAAINVVLGRGEVCYIKTGPTKIRANANVPNLTGALNPLGATTTLGALGIVPNLDSFEDSVVTLTAGSLAQGGTFLTNGSTFINGLGANANNTSLPTGASVVINVNAAKNVSFTPVTVSP